LLIDEIDCSGFLPEMSGNKRGNEKHSSGPYWMMMFAFNTILSMSTGTRELSKSALIWQKLKEGFIQILINRVGTEDSNRSRKLSMNHASKRLVYGAQPGMVFHEINPCTSRMIIHKNDILFVTALL
jgi:hypothetical protein